MQCILETERLTLRELTIADAQLLIDLNSDPLVTRYTGDGPVADLDAAENIITDIILPQYPNKMGRWAVHLKSSGEFIGWCGIKYISELDEYDLGYRFHRRFWGQGYATEAAKACVNYAKEVLKLQRLVGRVALDNTPSSNVLEKCGFKFLYFAVEHDDNVKKYELHP
jgi:RimJ/RimL family protein N-acetyltransferase